MASAPCPKPVPTSVNVSNVSIIDDSFLGNDSLFDKLNDMWLDYEKNKENVNISMSKTMGGWDSGLDSEQT
jgi:hypothetical protein